MMPQFDPEAGEEVRQLVHATVAEWPGVSATDRFGCPAYTAYNELFVIVETDGIILLSLPPTDRTMAAEIEDAEEVSVGSSSGTAGVKLPVPRRDPEPAFNYLRTAYVTAKRLAN